MKKDINIEMGARIKEKRKSMNYTREVFSEMIDISPQFLAEIESGKKGMSFSTLVKICRCLGVSCDYLILGREGRETPGRIEEMLSGLDEKYLPVAEDMLGSLLRTITLAESDK